MPRPPVGRVDRACSRTHTTLLWLPRRSLQYNNLDDQVKQAIKNAAGSGIKIQF